MEQIHQRLVVLPEVPKAVEARLGNQAVWRVDREFVSADRVRDLESDSEHMLPPQYWEVLEKLAEIEQLIPDYVPKRMSDG